MTLQARLSSSDPRLYNTSRDLAHSFGHLMLAVSDMIDKRLGPDLAQVKETFQTTDEQIGAACQILCKFAMEICGENPQEQMRDVLNRLHWYDINIGARIIVQSVLGRVILGVAWNGVREATVTGYAQPIQGYPDLVAVGVGCAAAMALSPWRRRLRRWQQRGAAIWRAIRGV